MDTKTDRRRNGRRTDRQMDGEINKRTQRQTGGGTDGGQTDRWTDRSYKQIGRWRKWRMGDKWIDLLTERQIDRWMEGQAGDSRADWCTNRKNKHSQKVRRRNKPICCNFQDSFMFWSVWGTYHCIKFHKKRSAIKLPARKSNHGI